MRALALVGSYLLPESSAGDTGHSIAGLSGAWYDDASRVLFVASDLRDRPALLMMDVEVAPVVRLVPRGFTRVERAVAQRTLDLEGVAPARNGHLFLTSEGEEINPDRPSPGIFEYDRDGRFVRRLALPSAYWGMRSNLGLEGLSMSPDGRWLYAATESALRQDGPLASVDAGAVTRILAYDVVSGGATREFAYRTEPVPRLSGTAQARGDNGISEILAIAPDELLVLERSYVEETGPGARSVNTIRIYHVRLTPAAEITGRWSLAADAPKAVLKKTLVLDLATVAPQFVDRLRNLENFEAMTFGPLLPDGRRTLLLISDDNASDQQVTALVVLAISQ